jgi:hypothetical protein
MIVRPHQQLLCQVVEGLRGEDREDRVRQRESDRQRETEGDLRWEAMREDTKSLLDKLSAISIRTKWTKDAVTFTSSISFSS